MSTGRSRHNSQCSESSEGEDERPGSQDTAMMEELVSTPQLPTDAENLVDNREGDTEEDARVLRDYLGKSLLEEDQSLETGDVNVATPYPQPHDVERSAENNNNNNSNNDSEATCPVCSAEDSVESQYLRKKGKGSDTQHTDPEGPSSGGVHLDVPVAAAGPIPRDSGSDEDSGTSSPRSSTASSSGMATGGVIDASPNVSEKKPTQETIRDAELRTDWQFRRSQAYTRLVQLIRENPDSPEIQRLLSTFDLRWIIFVLPVEMKVRLQVDPNNNEYNDGDSLTGDQQTDAPEDLRERLEEDMRCEAENIENQLKEHELYCSCLSVDEGCLLITLRAKDLSTLKKIVQRNERGTLSSCFEKILVSDKMRSLAAAQGKKLSVKVSLENKDEIKEAVELLDNLAAPDKNEGQGLVDKMTVTYCPEEGKWYWTPDAIEGVWMEANIRAASRGMYVDIPLIEKLTQVLDWLQKRETFQRDQPQGPCYMCYLRHRKAAEKTAVTGSL